MKAHFGYEFIAGKLVSKEEEAKILKHIFDKQIEYTDNPPEELVRRVIEIYEDRGEEIKYEDAKKEISYSDILLYLTKEMNSNPEFIEILKKARPSEISGELRKNEVERSEPIFSQEVWNEMRDKLKS
jgi:hypothetical protein